MPKTSAPEDSNRTKNDRTKREQATETVLIAKPGIAQTRLANCTPTAAAALALRSKINRQALDYWIKIRGTRPMPSRADLDPLDIRKLLPNVLLIDVAHNPLDFRYRLIGTKIVSQLNNDHTGKWMSEIPHQKPPSKIWSSCETVVTEKIPMTTEVPYEGRNKDFSVSEDIVMPLSGDGVTVNMLFVVVDFFSRSVENL